MTSSRQLRIGLIAPLWTDVPPVTYGGIERMVGLLADSFLQSGHQVTLFASGTSKTQAKLVSVTPTNALQLMKEGRIDDYEYYATANVSEAISRSHDLDILHSFLGAKFIPLSPLSPIPLIHSLRTLLSKDDLWMLSRYPDVAVSALSVSQISMVSETRRSKMEVIPNGCDFQSADFSSQPGKYLAFLGRMSKSKNPVDAIELSKRSGIPLILAGKPMDATEEKYFKEQVLPQIDGTHIQYVGEVDVQQRNALLKGALALVFPIHWDEPFGNVMVEAMSCGTPVLAYPRGSVPEVVDQGVTGYHASSVNEMEFLLPKVTALNREKVRDHARARFDESRMVNRVLEWYRAILLSLAS